MFSFILLFVLCLSCSMFAHPTKKGHHNCHGHGHGHGGWNSWTSPPPTHGWTPPPTHGWSPPPTHGWSPPPHGHGGWNPHGHGGWNPHGHGGWDGHGHGGWDKKDCCDKGWDKKDCCDKKDDKNNNNGTVVPIQILPPTQPSQLQFFPMNLLSTQPIILNTVDSSSSKLSINNTFS